MSRIDWDSVELDRLFDHVRRTVPGPDAERTVWALERALVVARIDEDLLRYLLAATVSLLAHAEGVTPREVLVQFHRRAVTDASWRRDYATLLA